MSVVKFFTSEKRLGKPITVKVLYLVCFQLWKTYTQYWQNYLKTQVADGGGGEHII
jgi:predicted ABC-type exoprotein transport system permease subunit